MVKFFVFSDVHGYYYELIKALDEKNYSENDWLIGLGDYFDRGKQPKQVMDFLMSQKHCILVRGNHEDLFEQCCYNRRFTSNDEYNGTASTIRQLGQDPFIDICCPEALRITREFRNSMVDYFETKNYVFVHGWVPITKHPATAFMDKYETIDPDWRDEDWREARWDNGIKRAVLDGLTLRDKTIICGHWNASYGHALDHKFDSVFEEHELCYGKAANHSPYYNKGIIAIDACTPLSKKVNVIVLEDELLNE